MGINLDGTASFLIRQKTKRRSWLALIDVRTDFTLTEFWPYTVQARNQNEPRASLEELDDTTEPFRFR